MQIEVESDRSRFIVTVDEDGDVAVLPAGGRWSCGQYEPDPLAVGTWSEGRLLLDGDWNSLSQYHADNIEQALREARS